MNTVFADHRLPYGQPPIYTSDVKRLIAQTNLLMSIDEFPSSVGLALGPSGTGKTTAIHAYRTHAEQLSNCAIVDVLPQITVKGLLSVILRQLGEDPRSHTFHDVFLQNIAVLQQGKTRLLILDQSDYLEREAFEVLSLLVEKTPCSLLLVGLPHLLARLSMVPSLADRVNLRLQFGILPEEEVYGVFLPQLVLPGWEFDPENEEDLQRGSYLWKHTQPSLRRACMILSYASCLAQMSGSRKITLEDLRTVISMTAFADGRSVAKNRKKAKTSRQFGTDQRELDAVYQLEG